jgi:DeoR/GlpR family transcriptional regulator of sugar metabolism
VASLLGTRNRGRVVALGGTVQPDDLACVGPVAAAAVRRYHADVAVIGAAGVSAAHGITELDDEAAEIHRLMIERSGRLVVLADGSKVRATAMAAVAPAGVIDTLVTDGSAPAAELDALRAIGVRVEALPVRDSNGKGEK